MGKSRSDKSTAEIQLIENQMMRQDIRHLQAQLEQLEQTRNEQVEFLLNYIGVLMSDVADLMVRCTPRDARKCD